MTLQNFVICGKAKEIFALLRIKTQRAIAAEWEEKRLLLGHCPASASCEVPLSLPCVDTDCPVMKRN